MIPGSANPLLLRSAAAAGGYQISRSLRFNSADSAYLSRTPASAGNRKTWTWAGWVKLARISSGAVRCLFGTPSGSSEGFDFNSSDQLRFYLENGIETFLVTTQVFRDTSAWLHIVLALDTTQATETNRVKIYVNGVQITQFTSSNYPAQDKLTSFNNNNAIYIGDRAAVSGPLDGYLADIYFIDGQALDPTSFTETDATTGQLVPKAYTGSYGTNGFHLEFADNSNNTATTLGKDTSGNSNNFTPSNLSVTAGAGNDSLVDSPTNYGTDTGAGGEVRGNYCTLNPLDKSADYTLRNGNLDFITDGANSWEMVRATFAVSSGKWYWEFTAGDNETAVGIAKANATLSNYIGSDANGWSYLYSGDKYNNSTNTAYGAAFTTNDVIGIAFDADAGSLYFYKNGTVQNSGTAAFTGLTSGPYFPGFSIRDAGSTSVVNFGQRAFAYTAPSGFKALCTANLPAPTIVKPSTVMDVVTYTGTGSALTPTSTLGFNPDLVWIKSRSAATDHAWYDAVRGAEKRLESNNTDAEVSSDGGVTAFNTAGFSVGTLAQVNTNAATYAGWCWDAGSSAAASNNSGTITSTVKVNTSAGFSIATYTGTGANATVGHGLGVAPSMVIVKSRSAANDWAVYHAANTAAPATDYLLLNSTAATVDDNTYWNDTAPTSTVFSIGTNADVNTNTTTYVAYCFAPVAGYSNFGSYTGNGSSDGPMVFTGMRPRFIMTKRTDTTSNWTIIDTAREGYNVDNDPLYPNLSDAEGTADLADILSNGFKLRSTDASVNASSGTYVFVAFAESPFNYSRAR